MGLLERIFPCLELEQLHPILQDAVDEFKKDEVTLQENETQIASVIRELTYSEGKSQQQKLLKLLTLDRILGRSEVLRHEVNVKSMANCLLDNNYLSKFNKLRI